MRLSRSLLPAAAALIAAGGATPAGAQGGAKRPITQETFDSWRSITGATLSPDGRWAAYSLNPQVGDGEIVARATRGDAEYRAPRGYVGRPVVSLAPNDSGFVAPPPQFSADGRFLLFTAYAPKAEYDRAAREKRRPADQPKSMLGIMELAAGKVTTVPRVRSFRLARESGRYVAYLLEPDSA
ncbi:MAG: hypothetical protein ACJ8AO_14520, partial [Gemmatimonadaceae bacterium]